MKSFWTGPRKERQGTWKDEEFIEALLAAGVEVKGREAEMHG